MVKALLTSHVVKQDEGVILKKELLRLMVKLLVDPENASVKYTPDAFISVACGGLSSQEITIDLIPKLTWQCKQRS